jgi:hypothetical protein
VGEVNGVKAVFGGQKDCIFRGTEEKLGQKKEKVQKPIDSF